MKGTLIAQRRFKVSETQAVVVVSMTAPRKVRGMPAFVVHFEISAAGRRAVHKVLGVDQFQALDLALKSIGRELDSERYRGLRWKYGMSPGDLGFPRSSDQKLPAPLVREIQAAVKDYRRRAKAQRKRKR